MLRFASAQHDRLPNRKTIAIAKEDPMTIDTMIENVADYGKDIKLNFSTHVRQQAELTPQQTWGTVLASAIATGNSDLIAAAYEQSSAIISPQTAEAARIAATIMAMNNIYYRFQHLASNKN